MLCLYVGLGIPVEKCNTFDLEHVQSKWWTCIMSNPLYLGDLETLWVMHFTTEGVSTSQKPKNLIIKHLEACIDGKGKI